MNTKINKCKTLCLKSNKLLISKKLTKQTFGNVSQKINDNYFVIKPSGVNLKNMSSKDMVTVEISTGKKIKSKLRPSSDTETHRILYKNFSNINGIAHAHSTFLTS